MPAPFYMMPAPQEIPGIPGAIGQALMSMAQGYNVGQERGRFGEDIQALQQRLQKQQWLQQMAGGADRWLGGTGQVNIGQPQWPTMQSQMGQQMMARNLMGMMGRDPTEQALNIARTQLLQRQAGAVGAGEPFTLTPGGRRFGPGGEVIAEAPPTPRAPTAFEQTQTEIDRIAAIPKDQRTSTEQARLDQLLERKPILRAGDLKIAKEGDETGLPAGTVFQADPQGNIKIISEAGGIGLSPADKTKLAVTQAKEFRTDPRIKNFQIIERSERGMQASLKMATSPNVKSRIASDQALGVLFQKMLDPESVVRESEFARTPEGAAATNRLLAIAPQLRLGGLRLLDEDRRALVQMAQKLLDESKITANRAFDEFETRADEIGLNKRIIFGGAKKFDIGQGQFTPANQTELNAINREIAELESRMRTPARRPAPIGPLGPVRQQPIPQPQEIIPGIF